MTWIRKSKTKKNYESALRLIDRLEDQIDCLNERVDKLKDSVVTCEATGALVLKSIAKEVTTYDNRPQTDIISAFGAHYGIRRYYSTPHAPVYDEVKIDRDGNKTYFSGGVEVQENGTKITKKGK